VSFLTVLTPQPVKTNVMENIYEIFCGSRMLYGIDVWGVKGECEIVDKIQVRSLKELIRSPRNTTEEQNLNLVEY
jgi:hypothetical protein